MANCTVCHIEYKSANLAESQRFCEQIFGWEFRSFGADMIVFNTEEGHIGGFVTGDKPSGKASPEVSYKVESVDDFVKSALAHGATVGTPKRPVPGVGFYGSIFAPDGNEFGLVEFTDRG